MKLQSVMSKVRHKKTDLCVWSILFIAFALFSFSCKRNSGGPCEYNIAEFEARVISIEPYRSEDGEQLLHIVLKFNEGDISKQNQFLEDVLPRVKGKTDSAFIERNRIKTGLIYKGTVSELKSGNCQSRYVSFNHYFTTIF